MGRKECGVKTCAIVACGSSSASRVLSVSRSWPCGGAVRQFVPSARTTAASIVETKEQGLPIMLIQFSWLASRRPQSQSTNMICKESLIVQIASTANHYNIVSGFGRASPYSWLRLYQTQRCTV